jgi:cytochrome c peroxidase
MDERRCAGLLLLGLLAGCSALVGRPPERPRVDPDLVQRGGILYLSDDLSGDGSRSCATCHPGGGTDGRTYLDGREVPAGSPGGRDVPALWGVWATGPYLADGSAESLGEVLERMTEVEMGGAPLSEVDRRALEAYLLSLEPFDRQRVQDDGLPVEPATGSALAGFRVFHDAGCALCHPPPAYMRRGRFDVGTGGKWAVPSLRGAAETGPYGHDGRWATLEEAVGAILADRGETLSPGDLRRLLEYLRLL